MIDPQLKDKIVLISGANHGIGAATAEAFASQGAKVFITFYRNSCQYSEDELKSAEEVGVGGDVLYCAKQQKSADSLVQKIELNGGVVCAHEVDLSEAKNIPILFNLCEKELGPVDILINNHTYCVLETFDPDLVTNEPGGVRMTSAEEIDKHFMINARAYTLMMSEYLKRYLNRNAKCGRIINTSTDAADAHIANISYAASKHAIESYSRSAALEMGKYGITVNIVSPGPIQTGYLSPGQEKNIVDNSLFGRVGEPTDVADVFVFLASEQARWLTGQLIYVGGGWKMHL